MIHHSRTSRIKRMKKLMESIVHWEGMEEDIRKYVEGCQRNKPDRGKGWLHYTHLPIAMHPWERIPVDLIAHYLNPMDMMQSWSSWIISPK